MAKLEDRLHQWRSGRSDLRIREGGIGVVGMVFYLALIAGLGLVQVSFWTTLPVVLAVVVGVALVWRPARTIRFDGRSIAVATLPGGYGPAVNFSSLKEVEVEERRRRVLPDRRDLVLRGPRAVIRLRVDDMADINLDALCAVVADGFGVRAAAALTDGVGAR